MSSVLLANLSTLDNILSLFNHIKLQPETSGRAALMNTFIGQKRQRQTYRRKRYTNKNATTKKKHRT